MQALGKYILRSGMRGALSILFGIALAGAICLVLYAFYWCTDYDIPNNPDAHLFFGDCLKDHSMSECSRLWRQGGGL